jgi:hypothetical protein
MPFYDNQNSNIVIINNYILDNLNQIYGTGKTNTQKHSCCDSHPDHNTPTHFNGHTRLS